MHGRYKQDEGDPLTIELLGHNYLPLVASSDACPFGSDFWLWDRSRPVKAAERLYSGLTHCTAVFMEWQQIKHTLSLPYTTV